MKKLFTLVCLLSFINSGIRAQNLRFLEIDTITQLHTPYNSNSSAVSSNDGEIFHSFVYKEGNDNFREVMGNTKIHVRNSQGQITKSDVCNDTVAIRNILFKKDGGEIYIGRSLQRFQFKGIDTLIPFDFFDQGRSFILETNAEAAAISFEAYHSIGAATLDKETNVLYFSDNTNFFDSITIYKKDLNTQITTALSGIYTQQRNEELQILITQDYIYIAGGYLGEIAKFEDTIINSGFPYNMYVAQYDKSGKFNWIRIVEDITLFKPSLAPASDQGVYIASPLAFEATIGDQKMHGPNWGGDFYLSRLDATGNYLWSIECPEYKFTDFNLGAGDAIGSDADYNVYLIGSASTGLQWTDSLFIGNEVNSHLTMMLVFNKDGQLINYLSDSQTEFSMAKSIEVKPNGDFIISGIFQDKIGFEGEIKNLGGLHHYLASFGNILLKNNDKIVIDYLPIKLFPNPVNTYEISILAEFAKNVSANIFDIYGRNIYQKSISQSDNKLDINSLNSGIYFVKVDGYDVEKLVVIRN